MDSEKEKRGRGRPRKEKQPEPPPPAKDKEEASESTVKHTSLKTTGKTTPSIVGPISEWACVPENLPNHPTLAFFGKRRTGKSTTITNIAYHCCQHIPFGMVMSDTAYAGNSFNL